MYGESRKISACCYVSEGTNNTLQKFLMLSLLSAPNQSFERDLQNSLEAVNQLYFNQFGYAQREDILGF